MTQTGNYPQARPSHLTTKVVFLWRCRLCSLCFLRVKQKALLNGTAKPSTAISAFTPLLLRNLEIRWAAKDPSSGFFTTGQKKDGFLNFILGSLWNGTALSHHCDSFECSPWIQAQPKTRFGVRDQCMPCPFCCFPVCPAGVTGHPVPSV